MWIFPNNFLFLSIARTLNFRLIRVQANSSGVSTRYCYSIISQTEQNKLKENLEKKFAIIIPTESKNLKKTPELTIPNYLHLKRNLIRINNCLKLARGSFKRKEGIFYSSILRNEARKFLDKTKPIKEQNTTNCIRCRNRFFKEREYKNKNYSQIYTDTLISEKKNHTNSYITDRKSVV